MNQRPVLIIGAGGHARVIASLLDGPAEFVDRDAEAALFAAPERLRAADVYIGIGDNAVRERIFDKLVAAGANLPHFIAPHAFVARGVEIGRATVILPGAVVMTGAKIGDNCIVNTGASVNHDCAIGAHTFISPDVTIPADVVIGERCYLSVKCATHRGVKIGNGVTVRSGSVVTDDVRDGVMVAGVPAVEVPR